MNGKQKLIMGITMMFFISLVIVGLTYAYFVSNVKGNEKNNSVSVSAGKLEVVYNNDDGSIIGDKEIIEPGVTFKTKTFSVTNTGTAKTDYVVILEEVKITWATSGTTMDENGNEVKYEAGTEAEFKSNDFTYTLECVSGCNGVNPATILPMKDAVLISNAIDVGETQNYSFTLTYNETSKDQSNDMNKKLEGKLNIANLNDSIVNPYTTNTNLLAYNIINNAINVIEEEKGLGYVSLVGDSTTNVAQSISNETESTLLMTHDDYGLSYYYRGNVENNYLEFNNMCWRIVRIEGDGSIKIVLAAQKKCNEITSEDIGSAFIGTGHYGHNLIKIEELETDNYRILIDYINSPTKKTTSIKYKFEEWLTSTSIDTSKLKKSRWCLGNTTDAYDSNGVLLPSSVTDLIYSNTSFYYDTYRRLYGKGGKANATMRCDGSNYETHESYIGALTADEVVFAGGKAGSPNYNYYLMDNASSNWWWTLSPSHFSEFGDHALYITVDGNVYYRTFVDYNIGRLRPSVSLKSSTIIDGGNGTITNPYIVS